MPGKFSTFILLLSTTLQLSSNAAAIFDSWSRDRPFTGNAYEVVWCESLSWREAADFACSKTRGGIYGHLATISSTEENQFIFNLLNDVFPYQVWVGGKQDVNGSEPGGGWTWVNGEGEIPLDSPDVFTNWAPGEPNNTRGMEDFMTMNRFGDGKWNDEGAVPVYGMVIEYEGGLGRGDVKTREPDESLRILFDYDLDIFGYFSGAEGRIRKASLQAAGKAWSKYITDYVGPIKKPSNGSIFEYKGVHPSVGTPTVLETNMQLPENTIKIFVGGRSMDGHMSIAPGGLGVDVLNENDRHVYMANINRGEAGFLDNGVLVDPPTDFATWGGCLAFNNLATDLHYDHETAVPLDKFDFYSHCLWGVGVILGYNNPTSRWSSIVERNTYLGESVHFYYQQHGNAPERLIGGHLGGWISRVRSLRADAPELGVPAMSSLFSSGSRTSITHLDLMGLKDIGWDVWEQFDFGNRSIPVSISLFEKKGVLLAFNTQVERKYYIYETKDLEKWSLLTEIVGNNENSSLFFPKNNGESFFKVESR